MDAFDLSKYDTKDYETYCQGAGLIITKTSLAYTGL